MDAKGGNRTRSVAFCRPPSHLAPPPESGVHVLLRKFTASRPSRNKLLELTCIISKSTRPSIRPEAILVKQTKKLHIMNRNIFTSSE